MIKCLHNTLTILVLFLDGMAFIGCGNFEDKSLAITYTIAGLNRQELEKVIEHYETLGDERRLAAARYLISNMTIHYTTRSQATDDFTKSIRIACDFLGKDKTDSLWHSFSRNGGIEPLTDASNIKANFLIDNIDKAFDAWEHSPWKKEVDFQTFCVSILPYRFLDEPIVEGWRDSLRNQYAHLIEGETDLKKAFSKIYSTIISTKARGVIDYPYPMNAIDMRKVLCGTCTQYCVFIGAIMRSLGIPTTIDGVDRWANYSSHGHSWLSLFMNDGTYTIADNNSTPRMYNEIDASTFYPQTDVDSSYLYLAIKKKRCAKIYRTTYTYTEFPSPFKIDVSAQYGLNGKVTLESDAQQARLCIYTYDKGWIPVSSARSDNGQLTFEHLGDSIVYLPIAVEEDKQKAVGPPFILCNGQKIEFKPNFKRLESVTLDRKYPLISLYITQWNRMRTGRFEGSNHADFSQSDILHEIAETPIYRNSVTIKKEKRYRYVRYVSPACERVTYLAEMKFWNKDKPLAGTPIGCDVEQIERCFDDDALTTIRNGSPGYWIGLDFGTPQSITSLEYIPANDGNFIVPGDVYELLYHDGEWVSLGEKTANKYSVSYDKVPQGSLLLLKNKSNGVEERIFTYKNKKQIWW